MKLGTDLRSLFASAALVGALAIAASADARDLRLGGVHAPGSFETRALDDFAERVATKSDGSLTVTIFPAGQLGDAVTMIENVMVGAQDMFANVADWNEHIIRDYAIMGMPFAFRDNEHVARFLQSEQYADIRERMINERGIRVVADNFYRLPRVLVTKTPVTSVDDLSGMMLRMANIDSYLRTWQALGANTTVLPWAESYLSLRTGIVDGMDSPLSSVYPENFYQAAPHITLTNHSVAPFNILISERVYQSLSEDHRHILMEAAAEAGVGYTNSIQTNFATHRAAMEAAGAEISEIDLAPFAERARGVALQFESEGAWSQGLFDLVQGL